jgi:mRNA interferase MazF
VVISRFDIYLVQLDPTTGVEMRKTRPCVVISPDQMHRHLQTVILAPLTSTRSGYPTRVACRFAGKHGEIALDHMRAVDHSRLVRRLGRLDTQTANDLLRTLRHFFA